MSKIPTLAICRQHLFTAEADIAAVRVLRARQIYLWSVANPDAKDRQFLDEFRSRFPDMGKNTDSIAAPFVFRNMQRMLGSTGGIVEPEFKHGLMNTLPGLFAAWKHRSYIECVRRVIYSQALV